MNNSGDGNTKSYRIESSLDNKIYSVELESRRAAFHFDKEFSFSNPENKKEVIELFGRHTYDWEKLGKDEKRRVRSIYQSKCKEYFIEHCNWPPPIATGTSKIIGLPNHPSHKIAPKKFLDFFIDSLAGSLPEKYTIGIAKLMNEERETLTKHSIIFDGLEIPITLSAAYATKLMGLEMFEKPEDYLTFITQFRAAETVARTLVYQYKKTHTPSIDIMFPFNPTSRGVIFAAIFGLDVGYRLKNYFNAEKLKDSAKNAPKSTPEIISPVEINNEKMYSKLKDYLNTPQSQQKKAI